MCNLTYYDAHFAESSFELQNVLAGFKVELERIGAVTESFNLPVRAIIEFSVVCFFKRNLAVDVNLT